MMRLTIFAAVLAAPAAAEAPCAADRARPGAAVHAHHDVIVFSPAEHGALRWCYFNSPWSEGASGALTVSGERVGFAVEITAGPEILTLALPGAVATNLDGVPLTRIEVPDGAEASGLLFRGMM